MQHHGKVFSATFSPDGHRIVTASEDHTARVWEAETSKPVGAPIEQGGPLHSAAFSPEGHRIVTASEDNTARVWEVETGKPVGVPMQHHGKVFSATFSPEGQRIVTASEDHTARVWEAATGKPVSAPMQHHGKVFSAAFSPDGHRIVTASEDHTARVWPVLLICCASQAEADRLASLAEAVGCNQVGDTASLSIFNGHELLHELNRHSTTGAAPELTLDWIVRRFGSRKYREDRR
jgi:WD40 repeat protein